MPRSPLPVLLALAVFLAASGLTPALAAPPITALVYTSITAPELASIMQAEGYTAKPRRDSNDDPYIVSRAQGIEFWVLFYGCDNAPEPESCIGLTYRATITPPQPETAEHLEEWTEELGYAHASVNQDGDVVVSLDFTLVGGITEATIREYLALWNQRVDSLLTHINWVR